MLTFSSIARSISEITDPSGAVYGTTALPSTMKSIEPLTLVLQMTEGLELIKTSDEKSWDKVPVSPELNATFMGPKREVGNVLESFSVKNLLKESFSSWSSEFKRLAY